MTVVEFHKSIYAGEAVDAAMKTFARFATLTGRATDSHWVVEVTATTAARERTIAGELANHALGATAARRQTVAP